MKNYQKPIGNGSSLNDLNEKNRAIFNSQIAVCNALDALLRKGITIRATIVQAIGPQIYIEYSRGCDALGGQNCGQIGDGQTRRTIYRAVVESCKVEWLKPVTQH